MDPSLIPAPEEDLPKPLLGQGFRSVPNIGRSDRSGDQLTVADWKALAGWLNPGGYQPTGQVGGE